MGMWAPKGAGWHNTGICVPSKFLWSWHRNVLTRENFVLWCLNNLFVLILWVDTRILTAQSHPELWLLLKVMTNNNFAVCVPQSVAFAKIHGVGFRTSGRAERGRALCLASQLHRTAANRAAPATLLSCRINSCLVNHPYCSFNFPTFRLKLSHSARDERLQACGEPETAICSPQFSAATNLAS